MKQKRRNFLKTTGVIGVAAGGGYVAAGGNLTLPDGVSSVGKPATENRITRKNFNNSVIQWVEFYESGGAILQPISDHGCWKSIGFAHAEQSLSQQAPGNAIVRWPLGSFDEQLLVNMKSAISKASNYPSPEFELVPLPESGQYCISSNSEARFEVPQSYMP